MRLKYYIKHCSRHHTTAKLNVWTHSENSILRASRQDRRDESSHSPPLSEEVEASVIFARSGKEIPTRVG